MRVTKWLRAQIATFIVLSSPDKSENGVAIFECINYFKSMINKKPLSIDKGLVYIEIVYYQITVWLTCLTLAGFQNHCGRG